MLRLQGQGAQRHAGAEQQRADGRRHGPVRSIAAMSSLRRIDRRRFWRLVTYNVLLGARYREVQVARVLTRLTPDVVALQEVSDLGLVRRLARELSMELLVGRPSDAGSTLHNVILSRFPVLRWRNHRHSGAMLRSHLQAELAVGGRLGRVRVHCVHLAARFGERANGEVRRMAELDRILGDITRLDDLPHLLCGDFNAIAPGDLVAASRFLGRLVELRRAGVLERGADGLHGPRIRAGELDPDLDELWRAVHVPDHLDVSVPRLPALVFTVARGLPRGPVVDRLLNVGIERWSVQRLLDLGYTDCYRSRHPRAAGYTCATWSPSARIDYVFAEDRVAARLVDCQVIGGRSAPDPEVLVASDHFPVVADFRL